MERKFKPFVDTSEKHPNMFVLRDGYSGEIKEVHVTATSAMTAAGYYGDFSMSESAKTLMVEGGRDAD